MTTFYLPDSMGWGNVALCLSDLVFRSPKPRAHKSLVDVDRGVNFSGFEITDDPNEEKLKAEFFGVDKTHIPLQAIIRIDEVEKEGVAKIKVAKQTNNIAQFPVNSLNPTQPTPDPSKV